MYESAPISGADTGHLRFSAPRGKDYCAESFCMGRVSLSPPTELRFSDSLDTDLSALKPGDGL